MKVYIELETKDFLTVQRNRYLRLTNRLQYVNYSEKDEYQEMLYDYQHIDFPIKETSSGGISKFLNNVISSSQNLHLVFYQTVCLFSWITFQSQIIWVEVTE